MVFIRHLKIKRHCWYL